MSVMQVAAAMLLAATAAIHSILGERRVISHLRAIDSAILFPRARRALNFTWHVSSLYMLLLALAVAWPETPKALVRLIGGVFLALGLLSIWMTRGRHVSGPLFSAAGLLALLS